MQLHQPDINVVVNRCRQYAVTDEHLSSQSVSRDHTHCPCACVCVCVCVCVCIRGLASRSDRSLAEPAATIDRRRSMASTSIRRRCATDRPPRRQLCRRQVGCDERRTFAPPDVWSPDVCPNPQTRTVPIYVSQHLKARPSPKPNNSSRTVTLNSNSKGLFIAHELNSTELTCNKSTQLHDAYTGHERQCHDLIGCSETRTVGAQSVLNLDIMWRNPLRELEFSSPLVPSP